MNRVILIGNLARDPELRNTAPGAAVCTFPLAVNRPFTNQQTGKRDADFIDIVTWRGTAERCAQYLAKGRKVAVVGSIQTRSYEAQDGGKRYVVEVVADDVEFLSSASSSSAQGGGDRPPAPPANATPYSNEDLLPFA